MKELSITEKIDLTMPLPIGKDSRPILVNIGRFYDAGISNGYITVKGVGLLDIGFVVTLVNGVD